MKNIAIFCVNFNTYDELSSYVASVENAAKLVVDMVHIDMFIADNTVHDIRPVSLSVEYIDIRVFAFNENLGYFGAINRMMEQTDVASFDFVIVSNVDLRLNVETFTELLKASVPDDVGWIAPQIYSEVEHRDRNPKIVSRYTLSRLKVLRLFYKYPLLNCLYMMTAYRKKKYQQHQTGYIYAGHGSFIILTKQYINKCGIINYPAFLFGEEIYLAEQCLSHQLKVMYVPDIVVFDDEHASTGKMNTHFYNHCNKQAMDYIIKTYY